MARKDNTRTRVTRIGKGKKIVIANNIIKNQSSHKIKQQKRRPRKGRLGGDRTAFEKKTILTWKSFVKNSMIRFCVHDTLYDTLENYKGNLKFMRNKKPYLMKNEIYLLFFEANVYYK